MDYLKEKKKVKGKIDYVKKEGNGEEGWPLKRMEVTME